MDHVFLPFDSQKAEVYISTHTHTHTEKNKTQIINTPSMSQSNICVGIRARPLLDHQKERRAPGLEIRGNRILTGTKVFDPDIVFNEDASQGSIVDACLPVFESVASGRNGTIMVYGQTGTGKTHTMFGALHDSAFSSSSSTAAATTPASLQGISSALLPSSTAASQQGLSPMAIPPPMASSGGAHNSGIVYSAIEYLLERVRSKTRNGVAASLSVSMIEIYNEKITDMLPLSIDVPRRGGGAGLTPPLSQQQDGTRSSPRPPTTPTSMPFDDAVNEELMLQDDEGDATGVVIDEDEEEHSRSTSATIVSTTSVIGDDEGMMRKPNMSSIRSAAAATTGPGSSTTRNATARARPQSSASATTTSGTVPSYNFKEGGVLLVNGTPRNNRSIVVTSVEDAVHVVRKALARRHVSPTAMNERSSRSHVIVMLSHDERMTLDSVTETSHLYLIDLAGSECLKKSLATGKAAAEAGMINKSLHALRNVITALTSSQAQQQGVSSSSSAASPAGGSTFGAPPSGRVHVPYRDSKLTELLQDSVGGTAKTMLIACISLVARDLEETKMTLEYATKARKIKNSPTADERDKFLLRIRSLEYQLQQSLNKTPGCVTISREFYEDMMQLNARLEESTENSEKLSLMLSHAEATQRIEKYQQEENARAIRAAEDERVRCVSYLLQQVAQLDDVKSRLAGAFASMQQTMQDAQCDWYHAADDALRRMEHVAMQGGGGGSHNSDGAAALAVTCPNAVDQLESAARRCQTSIDDLVSDVIEHTKMYESCVREMATSRSNEVVQDLQATEQKLHDIMAVLAGARGKVASWRADSAELAATNTHWVEAVQQRDHLVSSSQFAPVLSEAHIETVRDVRNTLQQQQQHQQEHQQQPAQSSFTRPNVAAVALQPQHRGSANQQLRSSASTVAPTALSKYSSGASTSVAEAESLQTPKSPLIGSAASWASVASADAPLAMQGSSTSGSVALGKLRTLWQQSASMMTKWKHETLAGAPSSAATFTCPAVNTVGPQTSQLNNVQRVPLSEALQLPPGIPLLTSPSKSTRPMGTASQSSVVPSASTASTVMKSTTQEQNRKMMPSQSSNTTRPTPTSTFPSALRPSALRNSAPSSAAASGGGSAMANAAAAAAARKRPRSFSSSSVGEGGGSSSTAAHGITGGSTTTTLSSQSQQPRTQVE
jgi:hypothetical protein